ncbi:hypothetical protein IFR35_19105 [Pseudomonas fluorescens]|uniref:hypothetical protein n=1 Tax=Pseudomonas fluorescens TaxID=294 RepID=UPI00177BC11F|nr:hypothetical protein [Pseudomonas fluorescens]MBD8225255.1 hypothetical protein [Pseudomonas fluorescens]MBD8786321.1 hypothetical protein [Pseudomonas fluorescens]MBD8815800.1 hypothetical protein [Pseudomonas fluorescens]
MVIGHRFERTAQDDLHVHSRNGVQSVFVLLTGAMAFILPLAFVLFWFTDGGSQLAEVDPLSSLLIVLLLLLIPALGLLLMVYTGTRETLLLSRVNGEGKRRTRNFFGSRERVQSVFSIDKPHHLELRRRPQAEPAYTQLWLVMRDGTEQRLTTDNVPVVPGSKRTDVWLRELADYLGVAVPTEVVVGSATPAPYRPAPAPAKAAKRRKSIGLAPVAESTDKLGIAARALLSLLGAFFAVLELTHVVGLVRALFTGRLRVSGVRSGSASFYWAEQPWVFSFNVLVGVVEVLIIGVIAWGCVRTAILGRMKANH